MLGGDRRRIELAYSLQLTVSGTPVIRYGEEIDMGDYLNLPRTGGDPHADAVGQHPRASASPAPTPASSSRPWLARARTPLTQVNVTNERLDPNSLLTWFERVLHALLTCATSCSNRTRA
jgi:maltose alpha-D-glucosyltransferase/alpha-amylase